MLDPPVTRGTSQQLLDRQGLSSPMGSARWFQVSQLRGVGAVDVSASTNSHSRRWTNQNVPWRIRGYRLDCPTLNGAAGVSWPLSRWRGSKGDEEE
ncbi:hypothetical protein AOLI_G00053010 [Acnodon oligacanthus]